MNARKILASLLCSIAILIVAIKPAGACQPILPDWWFSEKIELEINPNILPPGLSIMTATVNGEDNLAQIYIGNNTGSRIYLVSKSILNDIAVEQPLSGLPTGFIAFELLRGGQSASYLGNELQNVSTDFTNHNIQAPKRPSDIEIPAPQSGHLYILYDEQLITIHITMSYSPNPDYNPRNGIDRCGNMIFLMPLFFISAGLEWGLNNAILICGSSLGLVGVIYFWKLKNKDV